MKTRWAALIVLVTVLWGCGGSPDSIVNPPPPVTPTPAPRVTPQPMPTPQPTPVCRIRKLCDGVPF